MGRKAVRDGVGGQQRKTVVSAFTMDGSLSRLSFLGVFGVFLAIDIGSQLVVQALQPWL